MELSGYKNIFARKRSYIDKVYWILFGVLIIVAILALFSASSTLALKNNSALGPIMDHMMFIALGVVLAFVVQFLPSKFIRIVSYLGLALSIVFLMLALTRMGVMINGAKRWINLFGVQFQPSELAKLTLILVVSDLLSRIKTENDEKKYFFIVLSLTALVCGLIILGGNLSTGVLLAGIVFLLFLLARIHIKYLGTTVVISVVLLVSGYFFIKKVYIEPNRKIPSMMERASTWVDRVDDMIVEWNTPLEQRKTTSETYQRDLAKVAIARGGVSPIGVLPGNSQERNYLPQAFADYIFAIIVEESGIIGAIFLVLLYLAILFRSCLTSSRYADYAAMLMVMGLALMITCQALVSMMVSVGIGPVTGQPLPMISRGGTSALVTSLYFGIMMCVSREQNELHDRQQQAITESQDEVPEIILD